MNSNLKSISRSVASGLKTVEARASSLATDQNVLYIMLVIAVINIVGYLMMGNFEAVLFFAIVAYLSTFFTKNMVIVFLISILATNFLMVSKVNYFSRMNAREGMQTQDAAKDAAVNDAPAKAVVVAPAKALEPEPSAAPKPTPTNSKKTSGEKEGMNGKLAPAKFNDDGEDDESSASPFPGTKAQTNAQMEKAHDALQNIGSSGAMKSQTEEVIKQQKVLMDNIKTMQPFLETAERFLDKFNMKGIDGLLGKIGMGGGAAATPGPSSV
uniref:Uncharacterized protein n=1 Tax=viral metagenome TaxID=1070528 RepID=A0A6C0I5C8_9ZZZZ